LDAYEKKITLLMRDSDGEKISEIPFVNENQGSEENGGD